MLIITPCAVTDVTPVATLVGSDWKVGAEPVFPPRNCPVVPAAVTPNVQVLLPYMTPLLVKLVPGGTAVV